MKVTLDTTKQSFHGLLGKEDLISASSNQSWYNQPYHPFLDETKEATEQALAIYSGKNVEYSDFGAGDEFVMNSKTKSVNVFEDKRLKFTEEEYRSYRHFASTADVSKKVERNLVDNGLEKYINHGLGGSIRKFLCKTFHI